MAPVELTCNKLARLFDDVVSISTSNSESPDPTKDLADSDTSATEWSSKPNDDIWRTATDDFWDDAKDTPYDEDDTDEDDTDEDDTDENNTDEDNTSPVEQVEREVRAGWPYRETATKYSQVIVLLITWEEHDLGQKLTESVYRYSVMFEYLYKYEVRRVEMPSKKPNLALTKELIRLAEDDSPDNLFIIWYDGHGNEHQDRRGSPIWSSHRDSEKCQIVDSTVISTTLTDCEADILLVNNACCSLTCNRFNGKGIVESISASAFNTITYGSSKLDDVSPSMSWAALTILSNQRCVEEGITVAELHRRICLAVQSGNDEYPDYDEFQSDETVCWKYPNTRTQPVYTQLSAKPADVYGRTRSIVLGQLKRQPGCSQKIDRLDMIIKLKVDDPSRIDPQKWADWLLSAPKDVQFARLDRVTDEDMWRDGDVEGVVVMRY